MKAKLTFIAGMAFGYVLGSRAGRESYEKIKASAKAAWAKDAVQETVTAVQESVKDQAGDAINKLVHHVTPADTAGADSDHLAPGAPSVRRGNSPLDTVPEVSDEFPDAALPGGEGQQWKERNPSGGLPPKSHG